MQVTKGVRSVAHNSREALSALPVSRVASRVPLRKLHYAYGEGRAFESTAQRAEEKTAQVKPGFVESDCPSGFWDIGTGQLHMDNAQPSSDVSTDWHTRRARLIPEQPSPGDYIHTLPHLPLQGSSIKDLKQRVLHDSSDDDEFQALHSQGRPEGPHVPAVLTASNMVPAQPLRQWVTSSSSSPTNSKPTSAATTAGFTKPVKAGSTCSSGSSGSFDGAAPMHNMLTREGLKDINKKSEEEEEVVMSAVTVMAEHDHYLDAVLPGGIYPAHMDIGGYDGGFDGGYNAGSYDSSVADLGHACVAPASSETRTSARNSVGSGSARSGNSGRAMPAAVASSGNELGVEAGSTWDMDWLSPVQQPGVLMAEGVEGAGDGPDLV